MTAPRTIGKQQRGGCARRGCRPPPATITDQFEQVKLPYGNNRNSSILGDRAASAARQRLHTCRGRSSGKAAARHSRKGTSQSQLAAADPSGKDSGNSGGAQRAVSQRTRAYGS